MTIDDAALRDAVRDYARRIAGSYELGDALYSVTDHALQVLGCDGAGVSVGDTEGRLHFVTATEQSVVRIEEEQATAQEDPASRPTRPASWWAPGTWPASRAGTATGAPPSMRASGPSPGSRCTSRACALAR